MRKKMVCSKLVVEHSLTISSWNIHGLGQKHRDPDFLELLNHDINILIETWKNNDSDIQISGNKNYHICRTKKNKDKRNSGGIIVYIKKYIEKGIVFLENFQSHKIDCVWLKLDQSFFGLKDDLYICGVYIPPINSPHYNQEYEGLESEISTVLSKGKKNNGRF
jgi:hypothetical protein